MPQRTDRVTTSHPPSDPVFAELEARVHQLALDGPDDASLSINEWVGRIRAAATEAHLNCRAHQTGLEEQSWLEISAIAIRRIQAIRRLAPDVPDEVRSDEVRSAFTPMGDNLTLVLVDEVRSDEDTLD